MSTRLTNTSRERIAHAVLTHRFQEPVEALIADRAAFAEEVYNDVYRKADREKMAALPKGWLPETNAINVQFGETGRSYESLQFTGAIYGGVATTRKPDDKREKIERRAFSNRVHGCTKVYDANHRLAKKYADLDMRFTDLKTAFEAAKRQVELAIASASTINRLVEMWPEVEPFARSFDNQPLKVPALQTAKLNEILDLPVAA